MDSKKPKTDRIFLRTDSKMLRIDRIFQSRTVIHASATVNKLSKHQIAVNLIHTIVNGFPLYKSTPIYGILCFGKFKNNLYMY